MPAEYLVISTSLRPGSLSRQMGELLVEEFGKGVEHLDLREYPLPLCDGEEAYSDPNVEKLSAKISAARVIVVGVPIYNFYANAAAKNLVELTGSAWEDKIVGFLCAAGGHNSYMSVMSLANSLMLDFRCLIIPRFVYATNEDFKGDRVPRAELAKRLQQLAAAAKAIRNIP
jgi:NAD(P)H-dependent FMN reductase